MCSSEGRWEGQHELCMRVDVTRNEYESVSDY